MSYSSAWTPLQGTNAQTSVGKSYSYPAKKSGKNHKEEDRDSFWKLAAESYEPSEAGMERAKKAVEIKTKKNENVKLSKKAQKLLEELKEKYSNMDFFVASYSSDEEAQSYLGRGTKEYSVLIDPETLEAMAEDSEVRKQYEDVLDGAGDKLTELKDQLGEDADSVKSFGISIDSQGKVSYFAELDKISESRQNQVEKAKEKRAEERAREKKAEQAERHKSGRKGKKEPVNDEDTYMVKADSVEELVQRIREAQAAQDAAAAEEA